MAKTEQKRENVMLTEGRREKALLSGVCTDSRNEQEFDHSMYELKKLAEACDMEVAVAINQSLTMVNKVTYVGKGKVEEIKEEAAFYQVDVVIFNDSLSPIQLRNLQREIGLPILDRTLLILEIFSKRARTGEAKIQVEVAQLQYMLPRLVGLHEALNRQGGGSGSLSNKGAGEKKIELDKRRLERRLTELKRELTNIENHRGTQKKQRLTNGLKRVSLVGYTNAGKSTVMNALLEYTYEQDDDTILDKKVYEEDMLFATLDTTVRRISPKDGFEFLLSDTVGFVSNLPHGLINAFRSTLQEVQEADLLIHVVDMSDINHEEQITVTKDVLKELEAGAIPVIYVYNKADLCFDETTLPRINENKIYMSAKQRIGMDTLINMIQESLAEKYVECDMLIPYAEGKVLNYIREHAKVDSVEYKEEGTQVHLQIAVSDYNKYIKYIDIPSKRG